MPKKLNKEYYQKGLRTIVRYLKPHKREITILAFLSFVSAAGGAVVPYLGGMLFDAILGTQTSFPMFFYGVSPFAVILGVWLFANILEAVAGYFKRNHQERLGAILEADYIVRGFSKLLLFPLSFHKQYKIGEITDRVRRASGWLESIVNRVLVDLAPQFFSIIIAIFITFSIKPVLALLLLVAVGVYAVLLVRIAPRLSHTSRAMHRAYSRAYGDAHDTVLNVQAVKQATAEEYERKKLFRNFHLRAARLWAGYIRLSTNLDGAQRCIVIITQFSLFSISLYFIRNGEMTIGQLVAFNGYAALLFGPFVVLGRNWDVIQNGLVAIERSEEILSRPEEEYAPEGATILSEIYGAVEFQRVGFRYGKKQNEVLKHISFRVRPGTSVALVGESGVGKTTLIELISLYHRPTSGRVLIDGHDATTLDLRALRETIAVVPQEILLFNDTVKNNIRYGRFGAADEEVREAAQMAHADEFIASFPKKYEQMVGERGIKLSVGQKQRIAIARAILRNPRILILDEPTSALDAQSEKFISESLKTLMQGRTTFIIAHRLSTVRNADMILVLQKGKAVEAGSHNALIKKRGGVYRKLYELQIGLV
ncbi:MAG: ABC transporter ATP-binding protein [bacterium]|nr:ABC transporter ATP-binding protein [bacterium]